MINVGINGFGRIGRAITRIISQTEGIRVSAINDIDQDVKNLSYLLSTIQFMVNLIRKLILSAIIKYQ